MIRMMAMMTTMMMTMMMTMMLVFEGKSWCRERGSNTHLESHYAQFRF